MILDMIIDSEENGHKTKVRSQVRYFTRPVSLFVSFSSVRFDAKLLWQILVPAV